MQGGEAFQLRIPQRCQHLFLPQGGERDLRFLPGGGLLGGLVLALQFGQNLPRPPNDFGRQARQIGDLDAVALVCPAGDDLPQEEDFVFFLPGGDVEVFDPRKLPF